MKRNASHAHLKPSGSSVNLLFFACILGLCGLFILLISVPPLDPARTGSVDLTSVERTKGRGAIVYKGIDQSLTKIDAFREKIGVKPHEPQWRPEDYTQGIDGDIILDRVRLNNPPYRTLKAFLDLETIPFDPPISPSASERWPILDNFAAQFMRAFTDVAEGRVPKDFMGNNLGLIYGEWTRLMSASPAYPPGAFKGRGIVIPGGGLKYIISVYVNIRMLRYLGCTLPIEVWMFEKEVPSQPLQDLFLAQGAAVRHMGEISDAQVARDFTPNGFAFKAASIILSSFEEVLMLDADVNVVQDPSGVFDEKHFIDTGCVLWKDFWIQHWSDFELAREAFNLTERQVELWSGGNSGLYRGAYRPPNEPVSRRKFSVNEFTIERVHAEHYRNHVKGIVYTHDSGVMLVSKRKIWQPLMLFLYMNIRSEIFHNKVTVPNSIGSGDKETLPFAFRVLERPYYLVETPVGAAGKAGLGHTMVQYRPGTTSPMFLHRNCLKWRPGTIVSTGDKTWEYIAHIPPSLHTRSENRVDALFWKCAVNASLPGFVRQPFDQAIIFDAEGSAQHFGMEIVTHKAFDVYTVEQSKSGGKYVSMFGHRGTTEDDDTDSDASDSAADGGATSVSTDKVEGSGRVDSSTSSDSVASKPHRAARQRPERAKANGKRSRTSLRRSIGLTYD